MIEHTPADATQREEALDTHRSFIVEAPAGSGKTALLIQRYLKLLLDEDVAEPSQVLAITFTKKATQEVRNRVVTELLRAKRGEVPSDRFKLQTFELAQKVIARDQHLGWNLVDQPLRMNIRTIDSLAAEIARTLPILSGGFGQLNPTEQADEMYHTAARRTLLRLGNDNQDLNHSLRTILLHRDASLLDVENLLAEMLKFRDQWMRLVPLQSVELTDSYLDTNLLPQLDALLADVVTERLRAASDSLDAERKHELLRILRLACGCPPYREGQHPYAEHFEGRHDFPGTTPDDLQAWNCLFQLLLTKDLTWRKDFKKNNIGIEITGKWAGTLKKDLEAFVQTIQNDSLLQAFVAVKHAPPHQYPREQWPLVKALLRLLRHALRELKDVFMQQGACDFTEVSLAAQHALETPEGPTDYAAALGVHLRHLVMDEVQDTSTSQYKLLEILTRGWDGYGQTVFLVGDPKQSIYLFREARVEYFVRALREEQLGDIKLHPLHLTANFRSQSRLVESFNEIFPAVFAKDTQISYKAVDASVPSTDHTLQWQTAQLPPSTKENAGSRRILQQQKAQWEAQHIVERVRDWTTQHPERPYDIAVLVRNKKHAANIIQELTQANIPVRAVEMDTLAERPEVLDLLALTRALLHPADRTAWLAVFHAPWCGAGIATLHQLSAGDDPSQRKRSLITLIEERLPHLSSEMRNRVSKTLLVMKQALAQQGRIPLAECVERTWYTLGGNLYLDTDALSNAQRYFQMLETLEEEKVSVSIELLKQRLNKLTASSGATENAVQVLTIHKSKGLEWDLVLVPALERESRSQQTRLLDWSEMVFQGKDLVLFAPIQSKGDEATSLNKFLSSARRQREHDELKRLFYVAVTRARKQVHLYGSLTLRKSGEAAPRQGTLLHAAWDAARAHFANPSRSFVPAASSSAQIIPFPAADVSNAEEGLAIAAAADHKATAYIQQLPLEIDAAEMLLASRQQKTSPPSQSQRFSRPSGSFSARSAGNTTHLFLEELSRRSVDTPPDALLAELPQWTERIERIAVSHGLDIAAAKQVAAQTMRALNNMLKTPAGIWLLANHPEAASESAIRVSTVDGGLHTFRVDRTFIAGPAVLSTGTSHRWIVDFKTTPQHGDTEEFLQSQKALYAGQLNAYAAAYQSVKQEKRPVMLALYYPLSDTLISWPYNETNYQE